MAHPSHFRRALLLAAAAASLTPVALPAADLYWDANGSTAGTGGTGNWASTGSLWRNGSDTGTLGLWTDANVAVLGGTAGTVTLTSAISGSLNVLTTGYTVKTSATTLLTTTSITVGSGVALAINGATSGAVIGGTGTLVISGGGTVTLSGTNRAFGGNYQVNGTGTKLVLSGTNILHASSTASAISVRSGATVDLAGTNNYNQTLSLGGSGLGGGTLLLGNATALNFQGGSVQVSGTSKSVILSTLANTGTTFGGLGGNGASRTFTVNAMNDPSGVDLQYSAGWRNGTINKAGAGVMQLSAGFIINNATNYTAFNNAGNALNVTAGTFINEGLVKSVANVGGGTLKTALTSGTFDQVNVTSGTFEISRSSGLFSDPAGFVDSSSPALPVTYATGNKALNLRGGTLRYVGVNTDYSSVMGDLTGTSTVDTNGQNVTFATGLTGTGGLIKAGAGTLTLAGANTYAGATTINAGTLTLSSGSSLATSGVSVAAGATLAGSSSAGAVTLANGSFLEAGIGGSGRLTATSVSLADAAVANFRLRSADETGLAAYDVATSSLPGLNLGTLTLGAGASAKLLVTGTAGTVANGTYSFLTLSNASLPDISLFAAPLWSDSGSALGRRQTAALAYVGNVLQMTVTGSYPVWSGAGGMGWSTADNWRLASDSTATSFLASDSVLFDDTGAAGTVTFTEAVAPAAVSVDASVNSYTFDAAGGGITSGVLTKSGTASLTLLGSHGFSAVTLNAGRIRVGAAGSLGSGALTLAGGALSSAGADAVALSNAITLSGSATLGDATDNGDLTLSGIVSGSGSLDKVGGGQLTLSAANTFSGAVTVSGGILRLGHASALGSSAAGTSVLAGGTVDLAGFRAVNEVYTIAGSGSAGQGAIINTGADLFGGGIDHLILSDDATVGGTGRFDIRTGAKTLDLAGHQLTKKGTMYMALNGATVTDGDIRIEEGSLGLETGAIVQGTGTVTAVTGGTLAITWGAQAANITRDIVMAGGGIITAGANSGANSAITLQADTPVSVASGFTLTLGGAISGDYGLTKNSAGALQLNGTNSFTGPVLVNAGAVRAGSSAALGATSGVTLAADTDAQMVIVGDGLSFDRALTIGGGVSGGKAGQGALHLSAATGTSTWSGPITVLADIATGGHFGTGGATLVLSGAISAAAGVPVEFRNGTSVLSGTGSNYPILFLHSESTVRMGAADILPAGVAIQMGTSTQLASLDLNGFSQSAGSLSNATAAFANASSGVTNSSATGATLTLTGSSVGGVDNTVISNTATATGVLNLSPGAGALALNLETGNAAPVINAGLGVTIGATLTSANGFTKTGAGNLTLTANNSAGLAGTLAIEAGTLVSRSSGAMGTGTVRLSNTAAGANGNLLQMETAAQTHDVDFEVLASGQIRANNVLATLNGNFTLGDGVSLTFRGQGGANNRFIVTGDTSLAAGATSANVAFNVDSAQYHSYTGAMNLGSGTLSKLSGAYVTLAGTLTAGGIAAGANLTVNSAITAGGAGGSLLLSGDTAGAVAIGGAISASSVTKTGTSSQVLSGLSDIDALTVENGSIILAGGANGRLGASSVLSLGAASTSGKLVLGSSAGASNQTLGGLTLAGLGGSIVGGNASADSLLTLDLASDLSLGAFLGGAGDNENRVALAKSGAGILTLSAANTFAGGTVVNAGTLLLGNAGALGTGVITVAGGVLDLGGLNIANTIILNGGTLANSSSWTGAAQINGSLTNAYLASLPGSSFTIAAGSTVDLSSLTALGGKTLVYSGGTLTGSSNVLVEIADGTTLGADFGSGRALIKAGRAVTLTSALTRAVRYEGGTLGGLADYAGSLTVGGNSTLDLDGSGNTALTTTASVTVEAGSTFKGTGTFGGGTIAGIHAPGNSPGIQTSQGNLTYTAGATFEWELAANTDIQGNPTPTFDQVIVSGDLTFAGATALTLVFNAAGSTVDWSDAFWGEAQSWTLFDVSGSLAGFTNLNLQSGAWNDNFATSLATARPGFTFSLSQSGSDILLNYEAIPEPSTYGLILGGLALAGAAVRRRRKG